MIILDASVVNKLLLAKEENRDKAKKLLQSHKLGLEEIFVPDLLFFEVANTLATKTEVPHYRMQRSITRLYSFNFKTINLSEKRLKSGARFAKKYQVSVYDAIYAVLAKERKCDLITADHKFADKVNLTFIKKLSETGFEV